MSIILPRDLINYIGFQGPIVNLLTKILFKVLSLNKLNKLYDHHKDKSGAEFVNGILKELDIKINIDDTYLKKLPANKTFVIVSNHPHGILDGLLLLNLLYPIYPHIKIIVHLVVKRIKTLQNTFIPVNPKKSKVSFRNNLREGRKVLKSFEVGFPIILFPAGRVSSYSFKKMDVLEKDWSSSSMKWIIKSGLEVVPIYIEGSNSKLFYFINRLNENIGFMMLANELFSKSGHTITLRIGDPIIIDSKNVHEVSKLLRKKINLLKCREYES